MRKILLTIGLLTLGIVIYAATAKADMYDSSLVGWWRMDNNDISGTALTDRSGSGNTGTINGSPTTGIAGKIGQTMDFDKVDNFIDVGNGASLQITGSLTISAWVKLDTIPASGAGYQIVAKDTDTGRAYTLDFSNFQAIGQNFRGWRFYINGGAVGNIAWYGAVNPTLNQWYHVVGKYDTSAQRVYVYVNGRLMHEVTGSAASVTNSATNLLIGKRAYPGYQEPMDGQIDDVRVYNRALTNAEVAQIFINGMYQ